MNLLALCNRLIQEAGISSQAMTTTSGQTGELARVVNWIQSAWMDIQSAHQDWDWLRTSASCTTVAGQAEYTTTGDFALTDFGMWAENTFRNYPTATGTVGEIFMSPIRYDDWRNSYYYGALRSTQSRPMVFAVGPSKQICVGPVAAAGYTLTGDYFKAPSELASDSSSPEMPATYHMAIVWRALMLYGGYESAPEAYSRGEMEFTKLYGRLVNDRLPKMGGGTPIA